MWIFTKEAFVSVVKHRDKADTLIVRARQVKHLHALGFTDGEIFPMGDADYPFRAFVSYKEFTRLMVHEVMSIDYPDYKGASKLKEKTLMKIWAEAHDI